MAPPYRADVALFRARVMLKVLGRQAFALAKSKTRRLIRLIAGYFSLHTWFAWLWEGFRTGVTGEFKKVYQTEFKKAYLAEFAKQQNKRQSPAQTGAGIRPSLIAPRGMGAARRR